MKIGIILTFLDFRRDMQKVLEQLTLHHDVIIFMRKSDLNQFENLQIPSLEFRTIDEKINSPANFLMERLYLLMKRVPASKENYFLMEAFKVQNSTSSRKRKKAKRILALQKRLPKIMSYDLYSKQLVYSSNTKIDDIDQFIFLTEIYDDYLLARIIKLKKPFKIYVYSWDHPCKHSKFPAHAKYLVWNQGLKDDLINLQHISPEQISIAGASQFGFIEAYMTKKLTMKPQYSFEYIYFGCASGIESVAVKEILLIQQISTLLLKILPEIKLVVRPYPLLKNKALYNALRDLKNVVFDEDQTTDADEIIYRKYKKIEGAKAYFHIGTTLGLEAGMLGAKSFIINFGFKNTNDWLFHFIHQYQNEKYLIRSFPENCINSINQLEATLLCLDDVKFNMLSQTLKENYPVISFDAFSNKLIAT